MKKLFIKNWQFSIFCKLPKKTFCRWPKWKNKLWSRLPIFSSSGGGGGVHYLYPPYWGEARKMDWINVLHTEPNDWPSTFNWCHFQSEPKFHALFHSPIHFVPSDLDQFLSWVKGKTHCNNSPFLVQNTIFGENLPNYNFELLRPKQNLLESHFFEIFEIQILTSK